MWSWMLDLWSGWCMRHRAVQVTRLLEVTMKQDWMSVTLGQFGRLRTGYKLWQANILKDKMNFSNSVSLYLSLNCPAAVVRWLSLSYALRLLLLLCSVFVLFVFFLVREYNKLLEWLHIYTTMSWIKAAPAMHKLSGSAAASSEACQIFCPISNLTNYHAEALAVALHDSFLMFDHFVSLFLTAVAPTDNLQHLEEKGEASSSNSQ